MVLLLVRVAPALLAGSVASTNAAADAGFSSRLGRPAAFLSEVPPSTDTTSPAPSTYHPGIGPGCYGVWTKRWTETQKQLPHRLRIELASDAALLERISNHECPYGIALPGQVTWPQPTSELVSGMDGLKFFAVLYSYVPYALAAFVIIMTLMSFVQIRKITTSQLYVLLWLLQAISLQELVLKPLCQQPRPGTMLQVRDEEGLMVGSCVESCGMPSSHSMLACGWVTILLFDRIYRVHQFTISEQEELSACGYCKNDFKLCWTFLSQLSLSPWWNDQLTHVQFMAHIALWAILLIPVPGMRVVLHDHTMNQAVLGSCIGVAHAMVWWRIARCMQRKYAYLEDAAFPSGGWKIFRERVLHDFKLPHVPDAVKDASMRAASNLQGDWIATRDGFVLGHQFSVMMTDQPTSLQIVRPTTPLHRRTGGSSFPSFTGPQTFSIIHATDGSAFVSVRNVMGDLALSENGAADRVRFTDGTVWLRPGQEQREPPILAARRSERSQSLPGDGLRRIQSLPAVAGSERAQRQVIVVEAAESTSSSERLEKLPSVLESPESEARLPQARSASSPEIEEAEVVAAMSHEAAPEGSTEKSSASSKALGDAQTTDP